VIHTGADSAAAIKAAALSKTGNAFGIEVQNDSPNGTGARIWMVNPDDLGIFCHGRIEATGSITQRITSSLGQVTTYAPSATQLLVEDIGRADLQEGSVYVPYDPVFLQAVTIAEEHPPFVSVQPNGPTGNLWVEMDYGGFTVHDPMGSSSPISYCVKARRRGYENVRSELVER
jgi:hypothetical protein